MYRLYYLTDLHIGARGCNESLLKRHVKAIASDPDAYVILGGDITDAINYTGDEKRHDPEILADWCLGLNDVLGAQNEYAAELLRPVAHKIWAAGNGNHEQANNKTGRSVYREFIRIIASIGNQKPEDIEYGITGFVSLNFRRGKNVTGNNWSCIVYCHHGFGGGRKAGAHALRVEDMLGSHDCDLFLSGHVHRPMSLSRNVLKAATRHRKEPTEQKRIGVIVSGYLASAAPPQRKNKWSVDTYSERKGLPPHALGTFPIVIKPGHKAIEVHMYAEPVTIDQPDRARAPIPVDFTADENERKAA